MIAKIPSSWALSTQPIVSAKSGAGIHSGSQSAQHFKDRKKRASLHAVPQPLEAETEVVPDVTSEETPVAPLANNFFTQAWISLIELLMQSKEGRSWNWRGPRVYLTALLRSKTEGKFKKGTVVDRKV